MRDSDHSFVPVGEGNVVSIEFNLLYRWHATLSAQDTAWTKKMFEGFLAGQDPAKVKKIKLLPLVTRTYNDGQTTVKEFSTLARSRSISSQDVKDWTFDGYISLLRVNNFF